MDLTCKIELPLPPKELRPNSRPHFRAKAAKVKEYRGRAKTLARLARLALGDRGDRGDQATPHEAAVVQITYFAKTAHRTDPDNLIASLKSAIDGMTDAGVWRDDCDLVYLPPIREKDATNPRVVIEVYGAAVAQIQELTASIRGRSQG